MQTRWASIASTASVVAFAAGTVVIPPAVGGGAQRGRRPEIVLSDTAKLQLHEDAIATRRRTPDAEDGAAQRVNVSVEPGPLTVFRSPRTVTLTRVRGTSMLRGTVRGIQVVDARGTGAGWRLRMRLVGIDTRRAVASIDRVVATAASISGLHARPNVRVARGTAGQLLTADVGSGLGEFDVTLTIEAEVPDPARARVTAILRFELD